MFKDLCPPVHAMPWNHLRRNPNAYYSIDIIFSIQYLFRDQQWAIASLPQIFPATATIFAVWTHTSAFGLVIPGDHFPKVQLSKAESHKTLDICLHCSSKSDHLATSILQLRASPSHTHAYTMASRFVENLESTTSITHPHLNVSLDDILAEEGRKRSSSHSSEGSHSSDRRSGSDTTSSPTSPTSESKMDSIKRRALSLGSKKGRR